MDIADGADPGAQMAWMRAHPVSALAALVRGTRLAGWDFVHRGLYVVGWNDLLPHHGAAAVLGVCLLVFAWRAPGVRLRSRGGVVLLTVAVVGTLVGLSVAEYLIWTPPGMNRVFGLQPRYWLPVLPAGMLLVTGVRPRWMRSSDVERRDWVLIGAAGVLCLMGCTLPWMEAHAFYRMGLAPVVRLNWP
jgi:uncharacterized membrane protein